MRRRWYKVQVQIAPMLFTYFIFLGIVKNMISRTPIQCLQLPDFRHIYWSRQIKNIKCVEKMCSYFWTTHFSVVLIISTSPVTVHFIWYPQFTILLYCLSCTNKSNQIQCKNMLSSKNEIILFTYRYYFE